MIAYGAAAVRQAAITAQLGRSAGGGEPPPPPIRLTLAQFIRREVEDCRVVATLPTEDGLGVIRWGRRYVARPCHVNHPLNPGWVLVHDDPGALNHYERLFGRGENPALPGMPGPVRSDAAPGIPCPGCGALCDGSAVGDHDLSCPLYGEDAPDGPDWPEDA